MSPRVLLKSISKPHQYILNYYRYNTRGFVEELPQLPENRWNHACAALPSTGVRPTQSTFCRRLLLLEDGGTGPADFHLFTLFSLAEHPGHPSPPSQEQWKVLKLQSWEARSGWPAGIMLMVPTDLRWWLNNLENYTGIEWVWPAISINQALLLTRCLSIILSLEMNGWKLETFKGQEKGMLSSLLGLRNCPAWQQVEV